MMERVFCGIPAAFLLAVIALASVVQAQEPTKPEGTVILTITGDVSKANRGPFNTERDSFFKFHEIKFDRAFQLDQAMLDGLKQGTVRVNAPQTDGPVVLKGALLSEVFKLAGVEEGASVKAVALDGYTKEISAEMVAAHDWILASTSDGKPLVIGDQGPLWMVYTPSKLDVPKDEEADWPWALFYIEVKK
ncbi:MAG: hypothetical protein MPJ78_05860 [Hyphomicrobiaceae bacterium]|nr:hypothetical protein [Hyphomicrobiaceae bacterium]